MGHLSIRVLGSLDITLDAQPISDLESDKVRALLVYLAIAGTQPLRREKIAALLWPDYPEKFARANFRRALYNLRKALGESETAQPFLLVTRQTIQFNCYSDAWVDAISITDLIRGSLLQPFSGERGAPADLQTVRPLEDAVQLYRGEFLEGFSLPGSPAFDDWAMIQRERIHRQVMHCLCYLSSWFERKGKWEQALQYAWQQLELEPWRESGHRHVMRILADNSQRGAALMQYAACRKLLDKHLGVDPEKKTVRLYEAIRNGTLELPTTAASKAPEPEFALRLPAFLAENNE